MNNFKTGKNLFGISNYGSSGLYVDLLTNQSISGIKRFLSNLITNSNVNFNTTGNIGRIVFKPNEPAGFGGNLVSIYTTDENDGQGWIFSDGFLYYIGTGFISQKIIFDPTGVINAVGSITGGSLSAGTGTISTTGNISGGSLFVGSGPITGGALSATTGNFSSNVNITGATNGLIISGGFSGLFCNKIESQSGGAIVSSAVFNLRSALAVTNITLDPLNTIRLKINGITGTNSYLFFNNSNTLGFFNTSTGTNTYTITDSGAITCTSLNASAGAIQTSGSLTGATINATTILKTNIIEPYTSTTININTTSNFNWLKSVGVNRIKFYPSSTSGDIMQFFIVGDTSSTSGYLSLNNTGVFGYTTTSSQWNFNSSGDLTCKSLTLPNASISSSGSIAGTSLNVGSGSITGWAITGTSLTVGTSNSIIAGTTNSNTFQANNTNTYLNKIEMSNEYANPTIGEIDMISQYIAVVHPSNTLSSSAKYGFFRTFTGGDTTFNINNISGATWGTDWGNRLFYTDFTFQCQKSGFTSAYRYQKFTNSGTEIGSISMLSASMIAFNNTSDYRLKQDIQPLTDSLDRLMLLRPKSYRFIHDVESGLDFTFDGFLAHEVENIIPMAVSGIKDDPNIMQQMDYSKLTPLLTGAVQELNELVQKQQILIDKLIKRIEILENNVDINKE